MDKNKRKHVRLQCVVCKLFREVRADAARCVTMCRSCHARQNVQQGTLHGESRTAVYRIWRGIRARCNNPKCSAYPRYGARGITVAPEWDCSAGFARFTEHIGPRPSLRHSVDRIDNTEGYVPGNVRWALPQDQARNRPSTYQIAHEGGIYTLVELAQITGHSISSISYAQRKGTLRSKLRSVRRVSGVTGIEAARAALRSARYRCENINAPQYRNYGQRGIYVYDLWCQPRAGFLLFLEHIGPRPTPHHSLDRIDNDGHYVPGNVRWAPAAAQAANQRRTRNITFEGVTRTLKAWAKAANIPQTTLCRRLNSGWSVERALATPSRSRKACDGAY